MSEVRVRTARWPEELPAIFALRKAVFVDEQAVDPQLEWDGRDADCTHVLAFAADATPIGTGRLLPDGHIGRMAVLADWRGRGVGRALLDALVAEARRCGMDCVVLNSQVHAEGFYARAGFSASGEPFMEAGIPHRTMRLNLA